MLVKYALLSVGRSACDEVRIKLLVMDVEAWQTEVIATQFTVLHFRISALSA